MHVCKCVSCRMSCSIFGALLSSNAIEKCMASRRGCSSRASASAIGGVIVCACLRVGLKPGEGTHSWIKSTETATCWPVDGGPWPCNRRFVNRCTAPAAPCRRSDSRVSGEAGALKEKGRR
eukprot:6204255-Pleurochrysis_carterae.AAC.3